jgi:hypothetical protein
MKALPRQKAVGLFLYNILKHTIQLRKWQNNLERI